MEPNQFPMRINRYLSHRGYATRRDADDLIQKGLVFINGRRANLGDKVNASDAVDVKANRAAQKQYSYFAYYKPRGMATETMQGLKKNAKVPILPRGTFPVGRLDKDSSGLIILTNDGRMTDRLLNPAYEHEKEYEVIVDKPLTDRVLRLWARGVDIEDYHTKPAKTKKLAENRFSITLIEGKKHQIRRMCAALGYQVRALKRVRIMNVKLGALKPGEWRPLKQPESTLFLKQLGL